MNMNNTPNSKRYYSSVFISDLHLGSLDCKADYLLQFLNNIQCDKLYLVGDIVDMWAMSKQFRWPAKHNEVVHKIFQISQTNTDVYYLAGNHDEPLQKYSGFDISQIHIQREMVHEALNGKKYLVFHGDQCDGDVTLGKFEAWIGDKGYDLLLAMNRWYHLYKQKTNKEYWSLAGYIKSKIKGANTAIHRYKLASVKCAKQRGLDGVICGHIHHPESCEVDGVEYHNDGDWVENCSALVEDLSGHLQLVRFDEVRLDATDVATKLPARAA